MSHFKLYVVTTIPAPYVGVNTTDWTSAMFASTNNAVEGQLAPFSEWESVSDSDADRYIGHTSLVDDTEEVMKRYYEYAESRLSGAIPIMNWLSERDGERPILVATQEQENTGNLPTPPTNGDIYRWGYSIASEDGRLLKYFSRTNPNSKWDWYQLGGRYTGKLFSKSVGGGVTFDQLPASDIDWNQMIMENMEVAVSRWDEVRAILGDNKIPDYNEILAAAGGDHKLAKDHYWSSPGMRGLGNDIDFMFDDNKIWFNLSREEYAAKVGRMRIGCYAWLQDGKWHQRGEMGWFGISANEMNTGEWQSHVDGLIAGLGPDQMLSVIDCHI